MKVLFITRKYPPQVGGMEKLSYNLTTKINVDKKIISLGKKQWNLIWFVPYSLIYTLMNIKKYDVIHLSDSVLCIVGFVINK